MEEFTFELVLEAQATLARYWRCVRLLADRTGAPIESVDAYFAGFINAIASSEKEAQQAGIDPSLVWPFAPRNQEEP